MQLAEIFPTDEFNLQGLYQNRLDAAWRSLRQDIERWQKTFSPKAKQAMIGFHLNEFANFSQAVYDLLVPKPQVAVTSTQKLRFSPNDPLDADDFRAVVIGVITAHWSILRQVATQRVVGSPYLANLEKLDEVAAENYYRLRAALPPDLQKEVKTFAPIIHLGAIGATTVFNQNVPLVISVPYNAIDSHPDNTNEINKDAAKSKLAIPHEIGHAILLQAPAILTEIKSKVTAFLTPNGQATSIRRQILADIIVDWLEEILADMVGTALARENFVVGAMWITASSVTNIGLSDKEHPPTLVRPFIHLAVLNYLNQQKEDPDRSAKAKELERQTQEGFPYGDVYISEITSPHLGRQFKAVPALTFMTLDEVKNELIKVVQYLLEPTTQLEALGGGTLGAILLYCDQEQGQKPAGEPESWGKIQETDPAEFALTLPTPFDPDFQAPMTLSKGICWIPIIGEIICG